MAEFVSKNGQYWVYYLDGAFSDFKYAVVNIKGMKSVGVYKTLKAAEERAKIENCKGKKKMEKS